MNQYPERRANPATGKTPGSLDCGDKLFIELTNWAVWAINDRHISQFLYDHEWPWICTENYGDTPMNSTKRWLICLLMVGTGLLSAGPSGAEWYVAGQAGGNFADQLKNVQGTGDLRSQIAPDFDLKNAVVYGGKLGYFPQNGSFGVELDAFNSTPHIKNLDNVPGIHMRVTNVGVNLLLRYPGETFQPYAGIGGAALIAHIGDSPTNRSDSDVGSALNLLAGLRAFVLPYVAVFTEYKYTLGNLTFDRAFPPGGGLTGDYRAQYVVFGVSYHF
jgi:opacity protein-like surface antigen